VQRRPSAYTRGAAETIRLLLTDFVIPNASGRELAEPLMRTSPELRVFFMSGFTDDRVMRYGIQSSEVAFIQKPFEMSALLVKIRDVLGARELT
jgi:FixJ family two-component response regulator